MEILAIQALRGPNYWSIQTPLLIQVRMDTKLDSTVASAAWEQKFHEQFPDSNLGKFNSASAKLAYAFASIALQIQRKAGLDVGFLETKETQETDALNVVFEYKTENAGKLAAKLAFSILTEICAGNTADTETATAKVRSAFESEIPNAEIQSLIKRALENGIPILKGGENTSWQAGYGKFGVDLQDVKNDLNFMAKANRIPIIAVTGSNGKTTTTRLISHLIAHSGKKVGFTTSDGIYIGSEMIDKGDTTGPMSAEIVLRRKDVDIAVLESARGGIVRAGLGFDTCDIAVITNVQDDHLGISDINTMEELARVKSVVVGSVKRDGFAILNADNEWTIKIGELANCNVAWFSMDAENQQILQKVAEGGQAAFVRNGMLIWQKGSQIYPIIAVKDIPITFGGTVGFMTQNALAATLAAVVFGIEPEQVAPHLKTFLPSAEQTPGRMNIFAIGDKKVMVDFAHNPDGFSGIRDFLMNIESPQKIGIIVATGDRKESDVRELGRLSAEMFDKILIHQVKFLRGKTAEALVNILVEGMQQVKPNIEWERVPDEIEPLGFALKQAKTGSFIVALSDVLDEPMDLVKKYQLAGLPV